jgi:hypothetical protein
MSFYDAQQQDREKDIHKGETMMTFLIILFIVLMLAGTWKVIELIINTI